MDAKTPVSAIMTREPEAVGLYDNLENVRDVFENRNFHHLPVVQDGQVVGMLSYTDFLSYVSNIFASDDSNGPKLEQMRKVQVREVMTSPVLSLNPDDPIDDALRIFKANRFHSLPVIDKNSQLVGIVTIYDMLKVLERLLHP